jgi:predicted nucleic acid-binding protein
VSAKALPTALVVDASAAIQFFVIEQLTAQARTLFGALTADPPTYFHVPDLFYGECANILWKYVRRFGYPAMDARRDLLALLALDFEVTSLADLAAEALELAVMHGITVYDSCYVALSGQLGVPLITADEALLRKLSGAPFDVRWLGGLSVGTS